MPAGVLSFLIGLGRLEAELGIVVTDYHFHAFWITRAFIGILSLRRKTASIWRVLAFLQIEFMSLEFRWGRSFPARRS